MARTLATVRTYRGCGNHAVLFHNYIENSYVTVLNGNWATAYYSEARSECEKHAKEQCGLFTNRTVAKAS